MSNNPETGFKWQKEADEWSYSDDSKLVIAWRDKNNAENYIFTEGETDDGSPISYSIIRVFSGWNSMEKKAVVNTSVDASKLTASGVFEFLIKNAGDIHTIGNTKILLGDPLKKKVGKGEELACHTPDELLHVFDKNQKKG